MPQKSLIGSVIERKTSTSLESPKTWAVNKSGFPAVQHRSKSAFSRSKDVARTQGATRARGPPNIINGFGQSPGAMQTPDASDWRSQISEENQRKVANMEDHEREDAKREIIERFGPEIGSILKRAREARERGVQGNVQGSVLEKKESDAAPVSIERDASSPVAARRSITRPPSRVRFAELQPHDVHVYESAPPSPRRKAIALPPPPDNDDSVVSLGLYTSKPSVKVGVGRTGTEIEGTPEFIRQHYFPEAPADDLNLAWLKPPSDSAQQSPSTLRFDLSGNPIPPEFSSSLPTHLGLHHHAEGYHAGYTLDDIFLLSRSTVPAQRATMLGVLARIANNIAETRKGGSEGLEELIGREEELRKRMLAAGLEALNVRGSVGARAIELAWVCVVKWDEHPLDVHDVELESDLDGATMSIPIDHFLEQVTTIYEQGEALPESLLQILGILHRLAQHNNKTATDIVATPKLLSNVVRTYLTMLDLVSQPEPAAVELLTTLALSSRSNAQVLLEFADAVLRFVLFLPPNSPVSESLAISLSTCTLRFYATLGGYGLYAHIASTVMTPLTDLERYVSSSACSSQKLCAAWADLLSVWMTCAIDPHRTTPPHDILWSQVANLGWHSAILDLRDKLDVQERDREIWGAIWRAGSAWLTGCRTNALKGGQQERAAYVAAVKEGFAYGKEKRVIEFTLDGFRQRLVILGTSSLDDEWLQSVNTLNAHANILMAAINFWVSCTPPLSDGPLSSPPFLLPFSKISDACEQLVKHNLWRTAFRSNSYAYALVRPLASFLSSYLGLSRRLPNTKPDLWAAQTLSILTRLLPGHEEFALDILSELFDILNIDWLQSKGYSEANAVVEKGGFNVIKPFLVHTLRPNPAVYVSSAQPTVMSIALATTQRLPSVKSLDDFGLPLNNDWTFTPLDHLLRSGSSPVFNALPEKWNGSELDVVRASLLFSQGARDILEHYSMGEFGLKREEAVFNCMKIFMLEHEQPQDDSSVEVFRDAVVTRLMNSLLRPYSFGQILAGAPWPAPSVEEDLEAVASRFLGSSTPFFQYYVDFVALYDAVSFTHPLFARLLLPPTSMTYALDYRKHLWDDFGHVVKTIRTPVEDVITADIREYLYPVEVKTEMLRSYLRALLNDAPKEFLQLVAVHHVASNIWPDLTEGASAFDEDRAFSLLKTIVEQSPKEITRKVVTYNQTKEGAVLLPPSCYEVPSAVKESRMDCVKRWRDGLFEERLRSLFADL